VADARADVLIVGAGPAGAAAAATLRAEGFDGSILLAGREPDPPYQRPPATKSYLCGESTREEALLHPPGFWDEQGIDLRTRTSVMKLDTGARVATLSTKEAVEYGSAVLATGAMVRRLRVDGAALQGIHYIRALGNADALRADVEDAERVVLVGGSYIACEVAASLTRMGKRCTLVAMESAPMVAGFGERVAAWVGELLRSKGIELAMGETLAGFAGEGDRVERVLCESGRAFDADAVVMGTGAQPDVMLARSAGLELGETGGVRCDGRLRTSADGVWAAGDVCEYDSVVHGRRLRIEHWEVARAQGAFAARAILGADAPYDEIPYFWSDLADWATLEYVGPARSWAREEVRGSFDDGAFSVFYLAEDGRVLAALTCGRPADLDEARERIRSGRPLS
jgi:3-phenylpropionate/trans-cinnamate dioxygenase ferredoxin reductase component